LFYNFTPFSVPVNTKKPVVILLSCPKKLRNLRHQRLNIFYLCVLRYLGGKNLLAAAEPKAKPGQSNAHIVRSKNTSFQKIFYSFSHIELRDLSAAGGIENFTSNAQVHLLVREVFFRLWRRGSFMVLIFMFAVF